VDRGGSGDANRRPVSQMEPLSSLVPMVCVQSVKRSVEFYRKLGFVEGNTHTPEGGEEPVWAWLRSGGAHLMVAEASEPVDPEKQALLLYVYCSDVAAFRSDLIKAGVDPGPIRNPFYAPRGEFRVTDPDGYVLMVTHT
jgi:Glyoxalase/Bleomycin resistance protein/Dioxygenase superfamily